MDVAHMEQIEAAIREDDATSLGLGLPDGFDGFAMIQDLPANFALGSVGQYYWAGAAGTMFWIDPVEDIVIVSMMQLINPWFPYRRDVRNATYQAITESKE